MNISINLDSAKFEKEDSFSNNKEGRIKKADSSDDSSSLDYGTTSSSSSSTLSSTAENTNMNTTTILRQFQSHGESPFGKNEGMMVRAASIDGNKTKTKERITTITPQDARDRNDLKRSRPKDFLWELHRL